MNARLTNSVQQDTGRPAVARPIPLLAGLYVSQYLGVGFLYVALAAILRDRGASLEQLAALQVLGLVWGVKFAWAPLVDRYGGSRGHYRTWLLVLQPAIALSLLGLLGLDPVDDFGAVLLVGCLVVALSATQDIAADGLAVRILDPSRRGIGNGVQVAGGYLGNILGGGLVLVVYDRFGWAAAVLTLSVLTVIPTWQLLAYREPARPAIARRAGYRDLVGVFRAPGVAVWALLLTPLLWLGVGASYALTTPMLVDAGWTLSEVGTLSTVVAGAVALVCALAGGALAKALGRRAALLVVGAVQVLAILALLPIASGADGRLLPAVSVCALNGSYAAISAVVYTVNMDMCREHSAASDFTVLSTVAFVLSLAIGGAALVLAGAVGYVPVLLASAGSLVVALIVVAAMFHPSRSSLTGSALPADHVAVTDAPTGAA
ncbi:MAG: MFS transporter [Dermatophilaceae bacterium]